MKKQKVGGWVRHSRDTVYDNPWITVTHETVTAPSGRDGIYGVVHFKNVSVGVVPLDDEGFTWLVKQSRYSLDIHTWEIPEGGAPKGEEPLQAAQRELEEETGLLAGRWTELLRLHTSNSVCDEAAVLYLAQELSEGVQQLEATEDIEVRRLPLREAIEMALDGRITDALSVAALLRLQPLLHRDAAATDTLLAPEALGSLT